MITIDQNLVISIDTGWEVEVRYLNLDYKVLSKMPTVDTIVRCDSIYLSATYLFKVGKTLNVLFMSHNIVSLHYQRGRNAKKSAHKIQFKNPKVQVYSFYFLEVSFTGPLKPGWYTFLLSITHLIK